MRDRDLRPTRKRLKTNRLLAERKGEAGKEGMVFGSEWHAAHCRSWVLSSWKPGKLTKFAAVLGPSSSTPGKPLIEPYGPTSLQLVLSWP
jgi:hypothetical protein